jgi:hypothetical protein
MARKKSKKPEGYVEAKDLATFALYCMNYVIRAKRFELLRVLEQGKKGKKDKRKLFIRVW